MDWRDKAANGFAVTRAVEANLRFADFFIGGLLLLISLGGLAM
jgi:hypothetical protein